MDAHRVNERITVCGQIDVSDVAEIARAGYRSIICNRPDAETPDQTPFHEIEAAAQQHGLQIRWQPVVSGNVADQEGIEFGSIINELNAPTFAYCRSGTRCIVLWSLSQAGARPTADIIADARAAGYDLAPLTPRLEALAITRAASASES